VTSSNRTAKRYAAALDGQKVHCVLTGSALMAGKLGSRGRFVRLTKANCGQYGGKTFVLFEFRDT
jgi:hypothetical protein